MNVEFTTQDWYRALIEECDALISENVFAARWLVLQMYHELGKRIIQEEENFNKAGLSGSDIVQRVADSLGKSRRTVQYAIQFAKKYEDINQLPGGKNISWHKVCNKLLAGKSLDEKCYHKEIEKVSVCKNCHHHIHPCYSPTMLGGQHSPDGEPSVDIIRG
jgi:hypothetical protein